MEEDCGKYFLYSHIRLDKNIPFYIGIGTKRNIPVYSKKNEYKRAFVCSTRRNFIWKKITNKTKHSVQILMESNSYEFIKEKEREFIKLYGRLDIKTGCVSNMTDGGEGVFGRKLTKLQIKAIKDAHSVKVYNKKTGIVYDSINHAAMENNINCGALSNQLRKQLKYCEFQYLKEDLIKPYKNNLYIQILQKSTNKIFESVSMLCRELKISEHKITKYLKDSNSDFISLNKTYEEFQDKRFSFVLDKTTGVIYKSIKEAWDFTKSHKTYDSFRSSVAKKLDFRFVICDEFGNYTKREIRLPKTQKQLESVINIWKDKKRPAYITEAINKSRGIKIIQKSTGIIFNTIQEALVGLTIPRSTFIYNMQHKIADFDYEYLDKKHIKESKKYIKPKNELSFRGLKNIPTKSSKFIGVYWDKSKKKWAATCRENGKKVFLGRYSNEDDAAKAYQNFLNSNISKTHNKEIIN